MKKKTLNYIQFTKSELDNYTRNKDSCVERVNNSMHISFPPWGMDDFKDTLLTAVAAKKIGQFDEELRGIVLDVRNIKLEGEMSLLRYDTPELHLTIRADFYMFRPHVGVILKGVVKHVSHKHVSVLIYRVFNVSIRLQGGKRQRMEVGDEMTFKVKNFDLQNILPYIEGELVDLESMDSGISTTEERSAPTAEKMEESSSESDSEKEFKTMVVKNEVRTASSSSSKESASESEKESTPSPPRPIVVKKETRTASSSSGSDSEEEVQPQKRLTIKEEPKKTPSPEKSAFLKRPATPIRKKKVTIREKPDDLRLPSLDPLDREVDELINRYSHSSDTDASMSSGGKKKSTKSTPKKPTQVKRKHTDSESSSSSWKKPRPPTPRTAPSSSSDSESVDNLDLSLDLNKSINALLDKVKKEKNMDASIIESIRQTTSNPSKKKSRESNPGSPQLSSTMIENSKSKAKKKVKK